MELNLSINIDLNYVDETDDISERIRLAHRDGFSAVEMWGWRDKDLDLLGAGLQDSSMPLHLLSVDPLPPLVDASNHDAFLEAVAASARVAVSLNCPYIVCYPGRATSETRALQWEAVVDVLRRAGELLSGMPVTLLVENLNTQVDHPGQFLDLTPDVLDLVDQVASDKVKMLFDHYHSIVMGEQVANVLAGRGDRVAHVQIADVPGRGEPGSGTIDWQAELAAIRMAGYAGPIGLEYFPTTSTAQAVEKLHGALGWSTT